MLRARLFLTVLKKKMLKTNGIWANLPFHPALLVLLVLIVLFLWLRFLTKDKWATVGYCYQIISLVPIRALHMERKWPGDPASNGHIPNGANVYFRWVWVEVSGVVCHTQRTGRHDILFYELVSGLEGVSVRFELLGGELVCSFLHWVTGYLWQAYETQFKCLSRFTWPNCHRYYVPWSNSGCQLCELPSGWGLGFALASIVSAEGVLEAPAPRTVPTRPRRWWLFTQCQSERRHHALTVGSGWPRGCLDILAIEHQ